jgi:hypothetical protein
MAKLITDPIFTAIEKHRLLDAAYDDSLQRRAHESAKTGCEVQESAALIALLRTKPKTLAGSLAVLRYVVDWAEHNGTGFFSDWNGQMRSAGAAFLPMIADVIEAVSKRGEGRPE